MNNRFGTVVATAMLITLTSGCCCNMSSLWFGRGASCGLCNRFSAPNFGNLLQAPCGLPRCGLPRCASPAPSFQPAPYQAPVSQAPQCQQPGWQTPAYQSAPAADCGCNANHYAGEVHEGSYGETCGTCHSSGYGSCGCGQVVDGYSGNVHDPYLTGGYESMGSHGGIPGAPRPGEVINGEVVVDPGYSGSVIEGQIVPGNSYPGTGYPGNSYPGNGAPVQQDNFDPRPSTSYPGQGNYQTRKFDTDGKKILWEEPLPAGSNAL